MDPTPEQIEQAKENLRRHLQGTEQMNHFLDELIGPGNWVFDPIEDVWITPNFRGQPGTIIIQRGGDWLIRKAAS